jgi:transposase
MKLHANAALSLNKRRLLSRRIVEEGWSLASAAEAAEVSERTAGKWARRYRLEGEGGLLDRPCAARRVHNRTCERRVALICSLRRLRMSGAEIAEALRMPETTVSGILTRCGLGRLGRLGLEPARRYERSRPGELVHVDVKKLGRIERGAGHRATGRKHYKRTRTDRDGHRRETTGWSSSTSRSMTPPDSPTSRSWAMSARSARSAFCVAPWPSTVDAGSRSSG